MQGKLFQRCTLLYCSVLSLGGNVNTKRMSQPDMGSIFQIKNQWNILVIENYYVNYQNYQNSMLLTFSDTKRTLMHLFLFTNSAQRELVSICTQSIRSRYKRTQLAFLALVLWHGRSKRIRFSWNFEIHDFFLNTRTFFTIIQKEIEEGREAPWKPCKYIYTSLIGRFAPIF